MPVNTKGQRRGKIGVRAGERYYEGGFTASEWTMGAGLMGRNGSAERLLEGRPLNWTELFRVKWTPWCERKARLCGMDARGEL